MRGKFISMEAIANFIRQRSLSVQPHCSCKLVFERSFYRRTEINVVSSSDTKATDGGRASLNVAGSTSCEKEKSEVSLIVNQEESGKVNYFGYLYGVVSSLWRSEETFPATSSNERQPLQSREKYIVSKRISRSEIEGRTRALVSCFGLAESEQSLECRVKELCEHFAEYPASRIVATEDRKLLCKLLRELQSSGNDRIREYMRQCLSVLGYVDYPKARGVRILSIDGGGTRGMMGLEVLEALERCLNGRKVAEVFDHIVGVSTGAIIAALLVIERISIAECKQMYYDTSRELFNQGRFSGVSGLIMSHSYYNTKKWTEILKKLVGEKTMLETCGREGTPKLSIVSCIVNASTLRPYIFRNYEHPPGHDSHLRGGCSHLIWQAIQASAAAPGYFEEVAIGSLLHQDGGVLANNPTALALHEARMLWPKEKLQCVVSVGNGRSVTELEPKNIRMSTSIQDKISRIVDSATDTELVHLTMNDLLPENTYFRLNPYMSTQYSLDESDSARLAQMCQDARLHIRRNNTLFTAAAEALLVQPTNRQKFERGLENLLYRYGYRGYFVRL